MRVVLFVMVLGACGPSDGDGIDGGGGGGGGGQEELYRSGSRIRMKFATSPDGAKVFQGAHDMERGDDCSFQVASDGMTRCLPTSVAYSSGYFADASCTVPAGLVQTNCTPPKYIQVQPTTGCAATGPAIYTRGSAISAAYLRSGGSCVAANLPANVWMAYAATGSPIAPSEFQAANVTVE